MRDPLNIGKMNKNLLWKEFSNSQYPKWGTCCLLKYVGLPVLDCSLIEPGTSHDMVECSVESFIARHALQKVLVRTDAPVETGDYVRGGHSLPLDRVLAYVFQILEMGRAVILMLPTNRFNNRLTVNLGLDYAGYFAVEILGPGFDLADLNRGFITPEVSALASQVNWSSFENPHPFFIRRCNQSMSLNEMRHLRLLRIGRELLPAIGVSTIQPVERFAEEWLRENGYLALFDGKRPPSISYVEICDWYEISFLIASAYQKVHKWNHLVICASDLGDSRGFVYWDVVNPSKKFALPTTCLHKMNSTSSLLSLSSR